MLAMQTLVVLRAGLKELERDAADACAALAAGEWHHDREGIGAGELDYLRARAWVRAAAVHQRRETIAVVRGLVVDGLNE